MEYWNLRFGEGKRGELDEEMGGQKKGERKGEEENPRRGLMLKLEVRICCIGGGLFIVVNNGGAPHHD